MKQVLILIVMFITGFVAGCNAQPEYYNPTKYHAVIIEGMIIPKSDTIPSTILISHKSPSFGHGIDGYCVYKNDKCTGIHYKVWRKRMVLIGPEYIIWGCKRRNKQELVNH